MNTEPDGVGGRPACVGDLCITCSDMAVEVRVVFAPSVTGSL